MKGLKRRVHFVGVGGIGMSGLAEILLNLEYEVSGSDLNASDITRRLEELGLEFHQGHEPGFGSAAQIVVISAAIDEDNPEVVAALERGVPVIHRSDLLADLIRQKPNAVVVGGSHGKTTTTSMISAILDHAAVGATSVIGGILHRSGTNAKWGTGDCIVAEADEHDGSFLRLHPTIAVVTNVDAEHLEYYGTIDKIRRAFTDFCNGVPFYGYSILCLDDVNVKEIIEDIHSVTITYGLEEGCTILGSDLRLTNVDPDRPKSAQLSELSMCFDVSSRDPRLQSQGLLGTLEIKSLGDDNVRNALAACTVGLCLGIEFDAIAEGLKSFEGVRRRLQVRGEAAGVVVVEDYAHHPTEIASTMRAVKWTEPRRIIVVFQPHLYSRTKFFAEDFASVLLGADRTIVTDIYPSREAPMVGVDAGLIVDASQNGHAGQIELVRDMYDVPAILGAELEAGDVVLVLGAGDINAIVDPLLEELERR